MTIATNTHHLRPFFLQGAAMTSRAEKIKRLLEHGLLRDTLGRRLVLMDNADAERKLKEREVDDR